MYIPGTLLIIDLATDGKKMCSLACVCCFFWLFNSSLLFFFYVVSFFYVIFAMRAASSAPFAVTSFSSPPYDYQLFRACVEYGVTVYLMLLYSSFRCAF